MKVAMTEVRPAEICYVDKSGYHDLQSILFRCPRYDDGWGSGFRHVLRCRSHGRSIGSGSAFEDAFKLSRSRSP